MTKSDVERRKQRSSSPLRSRIGRLIFVMNLTGVCILAVGALILSELRAGLIEARVETLKSQAEIISNVLAEAATVGEPAPAMNADLADDILRRLNTPRNVRARIFNMKRGQISDSWLLADQVLERTLPPVGSPDHVWGKNGQVDLWLQNAARALQRRTPTTTGTLKDELQIALLGRIASGERVNENGDHVVSVSVPIQRVKAVLGVVTVESGDVDEIVRRERLAQLPFIGVALLATLAASGALAVTIASPIRRLASAADEVRAGRAVKLEAPAIARRNDEIGALAIALQDMTGALAERIQANERFAADVSHEIKNPLASIKSAAEIIHAVKDEEQKDKLLQTITQDVRRMDRLITDIANASRIEAEFARETPDAVDVAKLLGDMTHSFAASVDEDRARLVFTRDGDGSAIVLGRESPLGQVFRNLIDNALSFAPPGSLVKVRLDIEKRRSGRVARAIIEDEGRGIPPAKLQAIFDRFYTDRPKGRAFGSNSGLGLSIAKQIVEAHQGKIWAENIPGPEPDKSAGARFVVELPLVG
ncbi:MAG: stimulus-sensing domain-containing protein [Caulobacterales bacterium]